MSDMTKNAIEAPATSGNDWVLEDGRPQLVGSHCRRCHRYFFPQQRYCAACGQDDQVETALLGNTGRLYSFTTVHVAPRQAGLSVPYTIGYVDLDGVSDVRVCAHIDVTEHDVQPDDLVELVLEPVRPPDSPAALIDFKFRKKDGYTHA